MKRLGPPLLPFGERTMIALGLSGIVGIGLLGRGWHPLAAFAASSITATVVMILGGYRRDIE